MQENSKSFLFELVREWVLDRLPIDESDSNLSAHLNAMDLHDLLIVYHNWHNRIPIAEPRKVHISAALGNNTLAVQFQVPITSIAKDITAGNPLKKYLSRRIKISAALPSRNRALQHRRDLDLLLNSWGIHHLHLSTNIEQDGFATRTGPLLFAVFQQGHAYLLDIVEHGNWTSLRPLEVLVREFPESGAFHTLQGVAGLSYEPDEAGRKLLRNHAINTPIMIDGKAVMPNGGMVSSGTTLAATRASDMLLEAIDHFIGNLDNIPISDAATTAARPRLNDLTFGIHHTAGAGFLDVRSKRFFALFKAQT